MALGLEKTEEYGVWVRMKICLAGYGHKIHKNEEFVKKIGDDTNFLLSYAYILAKDRCFIDRFEWIKKNKEGDNEET